MDETEAWQSIYDGVIRYPSFILNQWIRIIAWNSMKYSNTTLLTIPKKKEGKKKNIEKEKRRELRKRGKDERKRDKIGKYQNR